jgi:hypothetical protein
LQIGRATIYRKIERYGLMRPELEGQNFADHVDVIGR